LLIRLNCDRCEDALYLDLRRVHMVARNRDDEGRYRTVAELMGQQELSLDELALLSGLSRRIAEAIARQRYTPSPEQRCSVSRALEFPHNRIVWGHAALVDEQAYPWP
jgi:hypothetical protein